MSRATGFPAARAAVSNSLRAGGRVAFPPALGEPDLAALLAPHLPDRADVEVLHSFRTSAADLRVPPEVVVRSLFGPPRALGCYVPFRAGCLPRAMRPGGELAVDVALVRLSPPDAGGMHSVGPSATSTRPLIESARLVVAEIDPELPRTSGPGARVHADQIDIVVDAAFPLQVPPPSRPVPPAETDAVVGHLSELVPTGATVQVGMGRHAQGALAALRAKDDIGLVCGLLSAPLIEFIESSRVRGRARLSVGEAIGGPDVMGYIDGNPTLRFETSETVHNATVLSRHPRFVTINSVLEVDLLGQANCEAIGNRVVAGLGGLLDFQDAARLSPGGFNIVIVPSDAHGRPRIVDRLASPLVSVGHTNIDVVVSTMGVADLRGASMAETRARLQEVAGRRPPPDGDRRFKLAPELGR